MLNYSQRREKKVVILLKKLEYEPLTNKSQTTKISKACDTMKAMERG